MANAAQDFPGLRDPRDVINNGPGHPFEPAFWSALDPRSTGVWKDVEAGGIAGRDGQVTAPFPDSGRWKQSES